MKHVRELTKALEANGITVESSSVGGKHRKMLLRKGREYRTWLSRFHRLAAMQARMPWHWQKDFLPRKGRRQMDWVEHFKALAENLDAEEMLLEQPVEQQPIVIRIQLPEIPKPEPVEVHWLWAVPICLLVGMFVL
jgi:hypothetical protein